MTRTIILVFSTVINVYNTLLYDCRIGYLMKKITVYAVLDIATFKLYYFSVLFVTFCYYNIDKVFILQKFYNIF